MFLVQKKIYIYIYINLQKYFCRFCSHFTTIDISTSLITENLNKNVNTELCNSNLRLNVS